jgi:hypothetical protein
LLHQEIVKVKNASVDQKAEPPAIIVLVNQEIERNEKFLG